MPVIPAWKTGFSVLVTRVRLRPQLQTHPSPLQHRRPSAPRFPCPSTSHRLVCQTRASNHLYPWTHRFATFGLISMTIWKNYMYASFSYLGNWCDVRPGSGTDGGWARFARLARSSTRNDQRRASSWSHHTARTSAWHGSAARSRWTDALRWVSA